MKKCPFRCGKGIFLQPLLFCSQEIVSSFVYFG